jgi:deoxyribodipyrimidine photolyase-like uncharacterized protein
MRAEDVCKQIIAALIKEGYRHQVRKADLEKTIMILRGIDPRTMQNWIKTLISFEYITPAALNVYTINVEKCPELIINGLKEKPQTKIQ